MSEVPDTGFEQKPAAKRRSGNSLFSLIALSESASAYERNVRYNRTGNKTGPSRRANAEEQGSRDSWHGSQLQPSQDALKCHQPNRSEQRRNNCD